MKSVYLIIAVFFLGIACSKSKREYHSNGEIKKEFTKIKGNIHGEFKEYYKNGNLKSVKKYFHGKLKDSITLYYNNKTNSIEQIIKPINDSTFEVSYFDKSKRLLHNGKLKNKNQRLGKWKFFKKEYDSIVEYINFDGKSFLNQVWLVSKENDTLHHKSNYYFIRAKDSVRIGQELRVFISLDAPYFSYDSDIELIIPKIGYNFNHDFSNSDFIEFDTLPSLKNFGAEKSNYPKDFPLNFVTNFGVKFNEKGLKKIRGILKEYVPDSSKTKEGRLERWLFIEKDVYVKDTL